MSKLQPSIRFGRFEVRLDDRTLLADGEPCQLGGRAFDLLLLLLEQHDRVVSREEVLERVWPAVAVEPNNLQVQMWALRRLLGRSAIITVPRRGYRYVGPEPVRVVSCGTRSRAPAVKPHEDGDQRALLRWKPRP